MVARNSRELNRLTNLSIESREQDLCIRCIILGSKYVDGHTGNRQLDLEEEIIYWICCSPKLVRKYMPSVTILSEFCYEL